MEKAPPAAFPPAGGMALPSKVDAKQMVDDAAEVALIAGMGLRTVPATSPRRTVELAKDMLRKSATTTANKQPAGQMSTEASGKLDCSSNVTELLGISNSEWASASHPGNGSGRQ